MRKYSKVVILALVCLTLNSCSSIFCGSKAKVTFESDIKEDATLTIDGHKHRNVTFPYTTKIRRGFEEVAFLQVSVAEEVLEAGKKSFGKCKKQE